MRYAVAITACVAMGLVYLIVRRGLDLNVLGTALLSAVFFVVIASTWRAITRKKSG